MAHTREILRRSFAYCGETCPNVEGGIYAAFEEFAEQWGENISADALDALARKVFDIARDEGTLKLRSALNEVCDELIEVENRLTDAESRIDELEARREAA